jgi:hypothetical protein
MAFFLSDNKYELDKNDWNHYQNFSANTAFMMAVRLVNNKIKALLIKKKGLFFIWLSYEFFMCKININ